MNKNQAGAAAVLAVVAVIILTGGEKPLGGDKCDGLTRVVRGTDGGKAYACEVQTDAGKELRVTAATHKRRPVGLDRCTFPDGGLPGELNRYDNLTGPECEDVAGSVMFGENGDGKEEDIVKDVAVDRMVLE